MSSIRVLIVEDDPIIALDIQDLLNNLQLKVAGIAYDSIMAFDMLTTRRPDIALLDITIKGNLSGVDIAKVIREKYHIPFIFLTSHADKLTLDHAKKTLPYGYVLKPFNENDLLSAIEMAMYRYATEVSSVFPEIERLNQKVSISLTKKEYTCLQHLCEGLTNKEMADKQFISVNTVKTHLKNLFQKLQVPNRTSAINFVRSL